MQRSFKKYDGEGCKASALRNDDFCFTHCTNPKIVEYREKVNAEGGQNAHKEYAPFPTEKDLILESTSDVTKIIGKLVKEVREGKISERRANCIGFLLNIAIKSLEKDGIEKRLIHIEDAISNRKN